MLLISVLASFVAFLDGSVVNVALPAIVGELGGGLAVQQWVVDAYLITLGALMLVAGSFSDLFGRKRVLAWGLTGFAATSVLCAIAPNGVFLVIMRALQGIAGALLVPSSLALIISTFSGPAQGKAIGSWTAWTGISFLVGPLLGGFLVDAYSWRLIFAINVLPIAATLWLLRSLKHVEKKAGKTHIDFVGATLCALGLGGPVYALIEQSRYGWSSPLVVIPLSIGLLLFGYFLWYEKYAKHPMLPLGLFKVRNFGVGNLATAAIYAGLTISTFLIVVFIQQVGGYSAVAAGVATLPITLIMFFLSSRFGTLAGKFGPRLFMTVGPLVCAMGFLWMLRVDLSVQYWTDVFPGVMLFGLGLSATVAPLTAAILGSIAKERAGIGSAINNAVARIAGLVAIAALGLVTGPTLDLAGFHRGLVVMAVLMGIGALISGLGIRNEQTRQ